MTATRLAQVSQPLPDAPEPLESVLDEVGVGSSEGANGLLANDDGLDLPVQANPNDAVDELTDPTLFLASSPEVECVPANDDGLAPSFTDIRTKRQVMERGHSGEPVAQLQKRLGALSYGVADTGVFDCDTETILKRFQLDHDLPPTGKLGPNSLRVLEAAERTAASMLADVQRMLKDLGFDPGPVDGSYGPQTRAAVTAFQRVKKMKADGIVRPAIRSALEHATLFLNISLTPGT